MASTPHPRTPAVPPEIERDLASDAFLADPYPVYARLRTAAPVAWSEARNSWLVSRYDDVMAALKDQRLANYGRMRALLAPFAQQDPASVNAIADHYDETLPFVEPARHTALKVPLQRPFSTGSVHALEPDVEALVAELVDALDPSGHDLMSDFATMLPINVIGRMLGVPAADRAQFRPWTSSIFAVFSGGLPTLEVVQDGARSLLAMRGYLAALIEERRRAPGDDLLTTLIELGRPDGSPFTDEVLLANCVTLYTAGHETTSGFIGNAFLALFRHPEQLEGLRGDPSRVTAAVEELLRYDTSVHKAWRLATSDVELGGVTIPAGDGVSALLGAANRDPAHFAEPDRLDLGRKIDRHFAFGHGTHFCLGAMLSRLEARVAIASYLSRFPRVRHDEDGVTWGPDVSFRSPLTLPVRAV